MKLEDLKPGTVLVTLVWATVYDLCRPALVERRRVVVRVNVTRPASLPTARVPNPQPEAVVTLRYPNGLGEEEHLWSGVISIRNQWFLEGDPRIAARQVKLVAERVTDTEEEIRELQAKLAYLKGLT